MRAHLFKFKIFDKLFSNSLGLLFEHTFTQLQQQRAVQSTGITQT